MRVLVTGGAGYVGSVSVEAFVAAGHDVIVLDDLSKGHRTAVDPAARLVEGSYGDPGFLRALLRDTPVDAVLHCAARSLVGESIANPALYYRENVAGGVVLLEALREAGVKRLVFSSTAAIYGTPTVVPIREDAVHAPINPYGETKRTFEGALRWYAGAYGLRSVSLRYFNVAGASAANGEAHDPETHLIPNVLAAVEGRGEVTVFGTDYPTADGTCIRDYIHVEDLARAHLLALEATAPDDPRTAGATPTPEAGTGDGAAAIALNLGNGGGFSVREVLAAVETTTGRAVPHRVGPRRAGDPPVLVADASRARTVLGWEPAHPDLEDIVASAWAWRRAHPGGYGA
jgi:UDP-glucose-4-epimerase GalE